MITRFITAAAAASLFVPAIAARAAEHPAAHPPASIQVPANKAEHPEHPQAQGKEVSKADISAGIKKHIDSQTKKSKDGTFHTTHAGKDLALALVKVHEDRLSSLGSGKYFACVDMKATDGTTYDIDFFLTGKPGSMQVTETSVHKVNGKPLYNWKEEGGVWKKVKA